jgi:hypothetical protein
MKTESWPPIATGDALDKLAEQLGVEQRLVVDESEPHAIDIRTRMPVETNEALRARILAKTRPVADKPETLHARAARVVEEWKTASGRPMLSPEASRE